MTPKALTNYVTIRFGEEAPFYTEGDATTAERIMGDFENLLKKHNLRKARYGCDGWFADDDGN